MMLRVQEVIEQGSCQTLGERTEIVEWGGLRGMGKSEDVLFVVGNLRTSEGFPPHQRDRLAGRERSR